jgi:hypothetical protein
MHSTEVIFIQSLKMIIQLAPGQKYNTEIANESLEDGAILRNLGRQ